MKVKVLGQLELEQPLRVPMSNNEKELWATIAKLPKTMQHSLLEDVYEWNNNNPILLQPLYDGLVAYFKDKFDVYLESIEELRITDVLSDTLKHLNEPTPASYFIQPEYITTEVCLTFPTSKTHLDYYKAQEEYYGNNCSEEVDTLYNVSKRIMRRQVEGVYKNKDNRIKDFCIFTTKIIEEEH